MLIPTREFNNYDLFVATGNHTHIVTGHILNTFMWFSWICAALGGLLKLRSSTTVYSLSLGSNCSRFENRASDRTASGPTVPETCPVVLMMMFHVVRFHIPCRRTLGWTFLPKRPKREVGVGAMLVNQDLKNGTFLFGSVRYLTSGVRSVLARWAISYSWG